jgi:hypothetical protein
MCRNDNQGIERLQTGVAVHRRVGEGNLRLCPAGASALRSILLLRPFEMASRWPPETGMLTLGGDVSGAPGRCPHLRWVQTVPVWELRSVNSSSGSEPTLTFTGFGWSKRNAKGMEHVSPIERLAGRGERSRDLLKLEITLSRHP